MCWGLLVVGNPWMGMRGAYFRGAGHRELNLKPSLACTMANSLVSARTAPLLAVYANWGVAEPTRATTLAVLMTLAFVFPCLRKLRTACLLPNHTPLTLIACVRSQIFSGVSSASVLVSIEYAMEEGI